MVESLDIHVYSPEEDIISQGEEGYILYFLAKGFVDVLMVDDQHVQKRINTMGPGSFFGEISLIF